MVNEVNEISKLLVEVHEKVNTIGSSLLKGKVDESKIASQREKVLGKVPTFTPAYDLERGQYRVVVLFDSDQSVLINR